MVDFTKCIRLTSGQAAREGGFTRRVEAGQSVYVKGWIRPQAGATSADIGIECDTEAGGSTALAVLNPTLPGTGVWAQFDGYVTVPAGKVWARPYMKANGGSIDFAEIYVAPAQATHRIEPYAVTETVRTYVAGNIGPYVATPLVLGTVTIDTDADEYPEVRFSCSLVFSGTGVGFIYIQRVTNGGAPAALEGAQEFPTAANGHRQRFQMDVSDITAAAGTHVYTAIMAGGIHHVVSQRQTTARNTKR